MIRTVITLLFTCVAAINVATAAQTAFQTNGNFPAQKASWSFSEKPFTLSIDNLKDLPVGPTSFQLYDGKNRKYLKPKSEKVNFETGTITVVSKYPNGLELIHSIIAHGPVVIWKMTFTNKSQNELWFEPSLRMPVTQKTVNYWDGYKVSELSVLPIKRDILLNTYPAACVMSGKQGFALGSVPGVITSYLENGVDVNGNAYYATRIVLPTAEKCDIEFVLYPFSGEYKNFDAMAVYQQAFPDTFKPTANTDKRLSGGSVTNSHYEGNRYGGLNTPIKVKYAGQGYVGLCWAYAFYRRQGDYFGRRELWQDDLPLTATALAGRQDKSKTELNVLDLDKMHQERAALFLNNDLRANTMSAFYVINTVDKGMIEKGKMESYVFPMIRGQPAYQGWALGNEVSGSLFAWASPYEDILKKDIPDLSKENDMNAIAYDGYLDLDTVTPIGTSEVYRGKLKYYLPGWSYDKDGKYIRQSIALQRHADFFHSIKKDGTTLGLWANVWWTSTLIAFKPDAYLYECFDQNSHSGPYYDMLKRGLYFRGHRPAYMHNVDYDTLLSRTIINSFPWEKLSPEDIRLAFEDYIREMITTFYQTNLMPVWTLVLTQKDIFDEMPYLTELSERGFYSPCPSRGDESLERTRYGQGLNSLIVISNRDRKAKNIVETIDNEYLGDFNVIPVSYRGYKKLAVEVSATKTIFKTAMEPQENLLVATPVALKLPQATGLKASSSMVNDAYQKVYTCEFDAADNITANLHICQDPHYSLVSVFFDGKKLDKIDSLQLPKGQSKLVITMRSKVILESVENLNSFDYGKASIVIDANASEREKGTAQMLKDYLNCAFNNQTVSIAAQAAKPSGNIILAVDKKEGICFDKNNNLRISAGDAFTLQQNTWSFLRLLDHTNPKVNLSFGNILEKPEVRNKMLNGNQIPFVARKTAKRVAWNSFEKGEDSKPKALPFGYVNTIEVPLLPQAPTITGRISDPLWKKAAVLDDFRILNSIVPATIKTEVRLLRAKDNLYIAFKCFEPDMTNIVDRYTERDSCIWEDDDVEVRLAPGIDAADSSNYPFYCFMVNSGGTQGDMLNYPPKMNKKAAETVVGKSWESTTPGSEWNAKWEAKTSKGKDFWIAEMKIPLSAMNGLDKKTWRILLARGEKPKRENSCWPIVSEGLFSNPTYFGTMTFKAE